MYIIGNGVDIIKNSRINNSLKIKGFLNRIFTEKEIQQGKKLKNKINFYAKRFAAKEAFVKAIGTGFRSDINFIDIEIKNYKNGKWNVHNDASVSEITLDKVLKETPYCLFYIRV